MKILVAEDDATHSRASCRSAPSARRSATTWVTGIRWRLISAGIPMPGSATASAPSAWKSIIRTFVKMRN